MAGTIHIGISGWSYPDWKGIFYPAKLRSTEWLPFYAQYFDTTEINASFYHLPKAQTVLNWVDKVPDDFKFCPKASRYLTHIQKLKDPEEPLQRFFEVFAAAKDKLGPILVQLPPSLRYDAALAEHFYKLLKDEYAAYSFAVEVRHDSWMADDALALMKRYDIAWVISQSGVGFPYKEAITASVVYFRFHGPGKLYDSAYTDEMLSFYAHKFKKWAKAGHNVWIYFNNCYNGMAIDNANTLKHMLGMKVVEWEH